jgi:hypothetical protein
VIKETLVAYLIAWDFLQSQSSLAEISGQMSLEKNFHPPPFEEFLAINFAILPCINFTMKKSKSKVA